jgi:hypothetical protein
MEGGKVRRKAPLFLIFRSSCHSILAGVFPVTTVTVDVPFDSTLRNEESYSQKKYVDVSLDFSDEVSEDSTGIRLRADFGPTAVSNGVSNYIYKISGPAEIVLDPDHWRERKIADGDDDCREMRKSA